MTSAISLNNSCVCTLHPFGTIDFNVSHIGFGGYRIHSHSQEHWKALGYALEKGFNLIDTSSNYTAGESERLVGQCLTGMIKKNKINREDVLIVSKAGYVQAGNLTMAREREANGKPFPEMVKYMDGCWHCIHPDFLENQLQRTLDNLQTDKLDIYLLHNPEYFLTNIKKNRIMDLQSARQEYERRIARAFRWLEEKVKTGKIQAYGISANTFVNSAEDFEFTSLERMLEIAEAITPDHNFKVIQFPFNLFEAGACLEKNQANGSKTLLEVALEKNMGTMINRPLNAITDNRMIRLKSFEKIDYKTAMDSFAVLRKKIQELESRFKNYFKVKWPEGITAAPVNRLFTNAYYLPSALLEVRGWEQWDYEKEYRILPQMYEDLNSLSDKIPDDSAWQEWVEEFSRSLSGMMEIATAHFQSSKNSFSEMFCKQLDDLEPALKSSPSLSRKALRILRSVPGVNCILLGMRKQDYVDDAFDVLKEPPIQNADRILSAIAKEGLVQQWNKA